MPEYFLKIYVRASKLEAQSCNMCVWIVDGGFFWLRASESVYKSLKVVRGVYYIDTDPKKNRFFKD